MTENEFRILYSRILEYYQYIEFKLKALCADCCDEVSNLHEWYENLIQNEEESMGKLIKMLKGSEKQLSEHFMTPHDFDELDELRKCRNYWCHGCFGAPTGYVTFKNGKVRNNEIAERLQKNYDQAVLWDERLAEICKACNKISFQ